MIENPPTTHSPATGSHLFDLQTQPSRGRSAILQGTATVAAICTIWPAQYLIAVPTVWALDLARWLGRSAMKLGLVGILLLCTPVIGWAILAAYLLLRAPRTPQSRSQAPKHPKLYRPVLLDTIKGL